MTETDRHAREDRIIAAAYEVLAEKGYGGASMLAVAKRAKASNETLYRWYADKRGLFARMIERNAQAAEAALRQALTSDGAAIEGLRQVAPVLLALLLGESAIILNKAAAADASGDLGAVLAEQGRDRLAPLISDLIARAGLEGALNLPEGVDALGLYLDLLVGDAQVRRCIGAIPAPSAEAVATRAATAMIRFEALLAPR